MTLIMSEMMIGLKKTTENLVPQFHLLSLSLLFFLKSKAVEIRFIINQELSNKNLRG